MAYYTPPVTAADLSTYLGSDVDEARATYLIARAFDLCKAIVFPLPEGSEAVLVDVATRAYANPTNAQTETTGPFSVGFGAASGGLWLTRQNKTTLRRLAGSGGAFTIDTMPATAGSGLPWWERNVWGGFSTEYGEN